MRRQRKLLCEGRRRIERQGAERTTGKVHLLLERRDRHRSRLQRLRLSLSLNRRRSRRAAGQQVEQPRLLVLRLFRFRLHERLLSLVRDLRGCRMQGRMRVSRVGRRELRGLRRSGGDCERTDGLFGGRDVAERESVQGRRWRERRRVVENCRVMPQGDVASVRFACCIAAAAEEQRLESIRPLLRSRPILRRLPPLRLDEQVIAVVIFLRLGGRALCPLAIRRQVGRRIVLLRRRPGLELTTSREILVVVVVAL